MRKYTMNLQREARDRGRAPPRPSAAEAGETRADGESDGEHQADVYSEPARHVAVVDAGAQLGAEAGARQHELEGDGEDTAHDDDEQPVGADAGTGDLKRCLSTSGRSMFTCVEPMA